MTGGISGPVTNSLAAVEGAASAPNSHATYAALVQSDADMIGHVAYSLYKRDKLKFCEATASKRHRPVTREELDVFIESANLPTRLDSYRSEAENALQNFAQEVLTVELDGAEREFHRKLADELKVARSFWRAVGENLVANILAIAVTALVVLVLYGSRIGFVQLMGDVFGYEVKERPAVPLPQSSR